MVDLKQQAPATETKQEDKGLSDDALNKYTSAGQILTEVVKKLVPQISSGKKILDLCIEGDKLVADAVAPLWNKSKNGVKISKGLAFPTTISVNNVVAHFTPLPSDPEVVLQDNDVVKVMLGVQIDGYAVTHAETIHLATEIAPVIQAAYDAAQLALRTMKPGVKNWDVTEIVDKAAKEYSCSPVDGMLSCQHEQNVTDGKKRIIQGPKSSETCTFEEGEVYGLDVIIVSGSENKSKPDPSRTSVYKRSDVNYQLKMKTSRAVFSEIQKKAGAFPFTLRALDDEKRARMGVQEAVAHGLLKPYDIVQTAAGTVVAEFFFTVALLPAGPLSLSPSPVWYKDAPSKLSDELKTLLSQPLRVPKKKKAKTEAKEES